MCLLHQGNRFYCWFFKDFFKGSFDWGLLCYFEGLEWSFNYGLFFVGSFCNWLGCDDCFCWSFDLCFD